jgi:hypothetical protein
MEQHIRELVTNAYYVIPYANYRELLGMYPLLIQLVTKLNGIQSKLNSLQYDIELHTDYLTDLGGEYGDDFDGELIIPAIVKLNNMLIPANIIIGLLSNPDYVVPEVNIDIIREIRTFVQSIHIHTILSKLENESEMSQDETGGKSKKRRRNKKRYTRR